MMNSPHEVGEEASSLIGSRCREKTGWPTGKMVVVVVVATVCFPVLVLDSRRFGLFCYVVVSCGCYLE